MKKNPLLTVIAAAAFAFTPNRTLIPTMMKIATTLKILAAGLLLAAPTAQAQVTLDPDSANYIGDFSGSIVDSTDISTDESVLTVADINDAGGVYSGGGGASRWSIASGELVNSGNLTRGAGVIVQGPLADDQQLSFDFDFNDGTRAFTFWIYGTASSGTDTIDKDFDKAADSTGDGLTEIATFDFNSTIAGSDTGNYVFNNGGAGFDTSGYDSLLVQVYNNTNPGNGDFAMDNLEITAIPEPSAFALLAGALGLGLVLTRRRR